MAQKNIIFLSVLLFLSVKVSGQTNFIAGEITKADGKVVVGQIDYQEWKINPKQISFRTSKTGNEEIYAVKDLSSFRIISKNETYKSAVIDVSKEPVEDGHLTTYENLKDAAFYTSTIIVRDSVFLLNLVRGTLNLYTLTDNERKVHFYVQNGSDSIKYLLYRAYFVAEQDIKGLSLRKTKDYARLLGYLTADCNTDKLTNVNDIGYNEKSLIKFISAYNSCKGVNEYIKKSDKITSSIYLFGGAELPYMSITDSYNPPLSSSGNVSPTFGLGGEIGISRDRNKLSVGIEAAYKSVNIDKTKSFTVLPNVNTYHYQIAMSFFNLNVGLKYILSKNKFNPYIRGGLGISLPNKVSGSVNEISTDGIYTYNSAYTLYISKTQFNIFAGVGIKMKNLFFETRFQTGSSLLGITGDTNLSVTYTSLLLGYSFFNW